MQCNFEKIRECIRKCLELSFVHGELLMLCICKCYSNYCFEYEREREKKHEQWSYEV